MSLPVCKFYSQNQTCRFGKNCRFSHISQRPPPLKSPNHKKDGESVNNQPAASSSTTFEDLCSPSICNQNEATESVNARPDQQSRFHHSNNSATRHRNAAVGQISDTNPDNPQICRYYAQGRRCYYGRNCRFIHSRVANNENSSENLHLPQGGPRKKRTDQPQVQNEKDSSNLTAEATEDVRSKSTSSSTLSHGGQGRESHQRRDEKRICPFYKAKRCNRGRNCKFLHIGPSTSDENISYSVEEKSGKKSMSKSQSQNKEGDKKVKNQSTYPRPGVVKQDFTFEELTEIGTSTVREGEVNTIKKRFPNDKTTIVTDTEDIFKIRIIFNPSDPDWPFDVKTFELLVTVPKSYPEEALSVKLPADQNMPETIRRFVELTIGEWLMDRHTSMKNKGRAELVFRPFLRWLDRNLEEITTDALKQLKRELVAKAAGMEFLSPSQLRDKLKTDASDSGEESEGTDSDEEEHEFDVSSSEEDDEGDDDREDGPMGLALDPEKKGTQMELRHLQLKENASALLLDKLKIVLQCGRCKNHSDVVVPQAKVMSVTCHKCNTSQYVHYRAALTHQFSSIVGYLDLDGCTAFDLILQDCRAVVTCMACSKLSRIEGLVSGQMIDGWCQACNARFKVATEAVKFSQLAPSGVVDKGNSNKVEVTKSRRPPKDPAIREGYPLPEFGTCKHYKHSYRWLRFPCCGKAYPCDVCHDKKEDHEFIFATRMICGHCCKEQNFASTRPCNGCSQHLTKIRSAHWEGGKGCRDKISMSKNDQQKYRNLSKTQSNHKKQLQNGGKKNTKLRHT